MIMQRLSLLARGTRYRWRNAELLVRFIPADAGNTRQRMRPPARSPVYPRWRGEHLRTRPERRANGGLSPLARGTPELDASITHLDRFIPAGAGNTTVGIVFLSDPPVYPRWRGEHDNLRRIQRERLGLSPLARGTQPCRHQPQRRFRFIPAGAGNTADILPARLLAAVYPRWRGEHSPPRGPLLSECGLSLLARGTPAAPSPAPLPARFIPAGAGNTRAFVHKKRYQTVYPRWRGEHA